MRSNFLTFQTNSYPSLSYRFNGKISSKFKLKFWTLTAIYSIIWSLEKNSGIKLKLSLIFFLLIAFMKNSSKFMSRVTFFRARFWRKSITCRYELSRFMFLISDAKIVYFRLSSSKWVKFWISFWMLLRVQVSSYRFRIFKLDWVPNMLLLPNSLSESW